MVIQGSVDLVWNCEPRGFMKPILFASNFKVVRQWDTSGDGFQVLNNDILKYQLTNFSQRCRMSQTPLDNLFLLESHQSVTHCNCTLQESLIISIFT